MSCNQIQGSVANAFSSRNCTCTPGAPDGAGRRQVALNASSGGIGPLPTATITTPINVVSTTIDTRDMCRTNNLLTFTCAITLPATVIVTLNFQIRRTVNDGTGTNVGSTYTFAATAAALLAQSFSFQFLDTDVQPGFYTYSVQLAANSSISIPVGSSINNAVLSVLAVTNR